MDIAMEIVHMSVMGKSRAAVELALARAGCVVDVKIVEQPRGLRWRGWGKIVMGAEVVAPVVVAPPEYTPIALPWSREVDAGSRVEFVTADGRLASCPVNG